MAAFAVSGAGAQQPSGKVLVAYFSHSGNTREVARQISEATGGDLFEIVPATPYPTEYRAVVDQGKKEIEAGVRPALKNPVGDLSQYDVIFVGSPCWWATIAPPVATFLTSYAPTASGIIGKGSFLPSDPYKFFVTEGDQAKNNYMMWALMIPGEFRYPAETNDIRGVYEYFMAWASSNGAEHAEWYLESADAGRIY